MSIEKSIGFTFKARYFENGVSINDTKAIWFVFHGYSQLAFFFIRKFDLLKKHHIRVIAPEGLSRFYLKESQGRVGASWMTREDRLTDIENYINYTNAIYQAVLSEYPAPPEIHVLGFSQGAATACRWVLSKKIDFKSLILWAGLFPPDLDFAKGREFLSNRKVNFIYGRKDPYLTDERFQEYHQLNKKLGVAPKVWEFDGGHDIDGEILLELIMSG